MNDQELADAVVALGVERPVVEHETRGELKKYFASNYDFVRDWRVAGALMEKILDDPANEYFLTWLFQEEISRHCESVPRAIIEACVKALATVDKEQSK